MPRFLRRWITRLSPRYGPHYGVAAQGVLRGLGFIYTLSFWSLASQIQALSGQEGLQPASLFYEFLLQEVGPHAPWMFPGLGWISQSPLWIYMLCGCGVLAGLGLLYGILPWFSGLTAWSCWVSLIQICQPWLSTPGDSLLAETGFYALFLVPVFCVAYPKTHELSSRLSGILLLNLLTVRVFFTAGISKLESTSGLWEDGTALFYFFETQVFPNSGAWFVHQFPGALLTYLLWGWMFVELMLPWYTFLPRVFRNMFAGSIVIFSLILMLVGQHGILPFLYLIFALSLVDDVSWRWLLPFSWGPAASTQVYRSNLAGKLALLGLIPLLFFQTFLGTDVPVPRPWGWIQQGVQRGYIAVTPPPNAEVPTQRMELALHGSRDGQNWIEYPFWLKPSNPGALPSFNLLHIPRMELALESFSRSPLIDEDQLPMWLVRLIQGILNGDDRIESLFPSNPFEDQPPVYLRLVLYDMKFADPVTRREEKIWWEREAVRVVGPIFSRDSAQ